MSEWKKTLVGQVCKMNQSSYTSKDHWDYVNYLDTGSITKNFIEGYDYIDLSKTALPSRAKRKVEVGDIVYSTVRPNLCHYGMLESVPDNCLVSTGFAVIKASEDKINPRFLYYFLTLPKVVEGLHSIGEQGQATYPAINPSDIEELEIAYPDRSVQDAIVSILSNYDSAIANCRRQIALLEEAAMRLYKEWFKDGKGEKKRLGDVIDFDPPVKLPKGVKRFSVPMGALQVNSMVLDRNAFEITTGNSGSKFNNGDTLLARITPCLENGKTAFVFGVDEEGSCGSTEFIVMRSKTLNPFAVYLLARTESFRKVAIASMSGADGRQRARKEVIANHEIFVPAAESIEKLGELCKPMFAQVETLQNQIY